MKKLLIVVGLLFVLAMSGCSSQMMCNLNPDLAACQITYDPITNDTTGEVTNDEVLNVFDSAEEYDFSITELHTFSYTDNAGIPYVDIEEFLYVMHEGLLYYDVSIRDTFTITFTVNYGSSIFGGYQYQMEIDAIEHTLYYNDINFAGEFNTGQDISHESGLDAVSSDYTEGNLEYTIDLDDYNIKIVEEDGIYFVPLYLANQLFTGDYLNVYQNGTSLYITDYFDEMDTWVVGSDDTLSGATEANIIENTQNFVAFFFDNFYGLKEYKGVDSYLTLMEEQGLYDVTSMAELDEWIFDFVIGLNDLHTSVIDLGYLSSGTVINMLQDGTKWKDFYDVYLSDACYEREVEIDFREYDDYYILELNEFNLDTLSYLETHLVDLDSEKPIYIDLACNPGGSLVAVLELLTFMTNDPITFTYEITKTQEIYSQGLQSSTPRAVENEFYLFTSKMTYSAANLFTSMVKDNQLATIIGNDSSGGACAVIYTVLPNNMIITYSSYMAMMNDAGDIIEDGIDTDYYYGASNSIMDMLNYVYSFYVLNTDVAITDNTVGNSVDVAIETNNLSPLVDFDQYEVVVTNYTTGEVLGSESYDSTSFHFSNSFTSQSQMEVVVYVTYTYLGNTVRVPVYDIITNTTI